MTVRFPRRAERVFTIADVAALPEELPSGPVLYELEKGRLIVMAPPGDIHGQSESRIAYYLIHFGDRKGHGKTRSGEVGLILGRGKYPTLYGVDALFVSKDNLPIKVSNEGYLETIPSIVAEVRSKNDSNKRVAEKVEAYLDAGVDLVWSIDPVQMVVTVYRPRAKPQTLTEKDTLVANGIIPGFSVPLTDLFAD